MTIEDLYIVVGRKIKYYRELKGYSQAELADKSSINRATLSNIESGKQQTSLHLLYKIGNALGTEVSFFLPTLIDVNANSISLKDKINNYSIDEETKNAILTLLNKSIKNDK